jgi:hypothetical protein
MSDSGGNLKLTNDIKELLIFYIKTNYENYLKQNNIKKINDSDIEKVTLNIFKTKKDHAKQFAKNSLKEVYNDACPNDAVINMILYEIFEDEKLIIYKITEKIKEHQK